MLIDTHAHLDFREFDQDRDQVIKRAFRKGIEKIINIGCNLERSRNSIKLAERYDNIYAAVGIHPHDIVNYQLSEAETELKKLAKQNKVVAIGECGLDYFRMDKENKEENIRRQKDFFIMQIRIARDFNLPLIIHCRDAYSDLLEVLKEQANSHKGVTHCFSASFKYAKEFLDLGFLISFTGNITYAKEDDAILETVKEISLDKIMVETDSPYLAPVPHRGERNEPAFVRYIAEKITEIKEIDFEKVAEQTTKNAIKIFNLK
jgi:TatD DNase family protein